VADAAVALMMLDLRFKQINDTMGHPAGDELLKQVSERLHSYQRDRERRQASGDDFKSCCQTWMIAETKQRSCRASA
jgi:diguanylate cyclase (GGDEF)-like protein